MSRKRDAATHPVAEFPASPTGLGVNPAMKPQSRGEPRVDSVNCCGPGMGPLAASGVLLRRFRGPSNNPEVQLWKPTCSPALERPHPHPLAERGRLSKTPPMPPSSPAPRHPLPYSLCL